MQNGVGIGAGVRSGDRACFNLLPSRLSVIQGELIEPKLSV